MEIIKNYNNKILQLKKKNSNCPTCKKTINHIYSPFCSKKCSDIDLAKWLSDENIIVSNFE